GRLTLLSVVSRVTCVVLTLRHTRFFCFFFFQCSGHHRHLHSFPTRRSSDLDQRSRSGPPSWRPIRGEPFPSLFRPGAQFDVADRDRKSTRLNSSHQIISYAVFCLKKKKKKKHEHPSPT